MGDGIVIPGIDGDARLCTSPQNVSFLPMGKNQIDENEMGEMKHPAVYTMTFKTTAVTPNLGSKYA